MNQKTVDHEIWGQENKGQYKLSIIARLKGPLVSNVQYILRLEEPEGYSIDFMTTLDGFKELGELFQALHYFCRLPIYANETHAERLKNLLTSENIKNFAEIIKSSRL